MRGVCFFIRVRKFRRAQLYLEMNGIEIPFEFCLIFSSWLLELHSVTKITIVMIVKTTGSRLNLVTPIIPAPASLHFECNLSCRSFFLKTRHEEEIQWWNLIYIPRA